MFQIDLTSTGDLCLHMPTGRTVEIMATPEGLAFVKKILHDYKRGVRNQLGYIKGLPTQHVVDKQFADQFLEEKKRKAEEAKREKFEREMNINLDELYFNI